MSVVINNPVYISLISNSRVYHKKEKIRYKQNKLFIPVEREYIEECGYINCSTYCCSWGNKTGKNLDNEEFVQTIPIGNWYTTSKIREIATGRYVDAEYLKVLAKLGLLECKKEQDTKHRVVMRYFWKRK